MMREALLLVLEGVTPFADARALQRRSGGPGHLLVPRALLAERGVEVHDIERGGGATYHGPGQLVAYPILDLRALDEDVVRFMRALEESILRTVADFGITGSRRRGFPGGWVGGGKIDAGGGGAGAPLPPRPQEGERCFPDAAPPPLRDPGDPRRPGARSDHRRGDHPDLPDLHLRAAGAGRAPRLRLLAHRQSDAHRAGTGAGLTGRGGIRTGLRLGHGRHHDRRAAALPRRPRRRTR